MAVYLVGRRCDTPACHCGAPPAFKRLPGCGRLARTGEAANPAKIAGVAGGDDFAGPIDPGAPVVPPHPAKAGRPATGAGSADALDAARSAHAAHPAKLCVRVMPQDTGTAPRLPRSRRHRPGGDRRTAKAARLATGTDSAAARDAARSARGANPANLCVREMPRGAGTAPRLPRSRRHGPGGDRRPAKAAGRATGPDSADARDAARSAHAAHPAKLCVREMPRDAGTAPRPPRWRCHRSGGDRRTAKAFRLATRPEPADVPDVARSAHGAKPAKLCVREMPQDAGTASKLPRSRRHGPGGDRRPAKSAGPATGPELAAAGDAARSARGANPANLRVREMPRDAARCRTAPPTPRPGARGRGTETA
jgi:hypothetical protein